MIHWSIDSLKLNYPICVIVIPFFDDKLFCKMLLNKLLNFPLFKDVIIPVINLSLLFFVFQASFNEAWLFRSRILPLLLFCLFISVVQMPRHKNILSRKLFIVLLESPNVDQNRASNFRNATHFSQGLNEEWIRRKMMDDSNRNDCVEWVRSQG